ncbi:nitroreductase family protein [Proteocatella sphenisci]|uniref:nitroreductase family protein n=1 Tax=Proteocatella sphenisci TaxID=181070 RepID=UPI000490B98E|nr:nitroreductase family protein [Proteocatella sphenisci]
MNYEKIMTEIKSVREFKKQAVDSNLLSLIIKETEQIDSINNSDVKLSVIEDGEKFFNDYDGKIGYFGKLIKAPKYILIFGKNDENTKFKAGYMTEWMRFRLHDNDLGSCWISATAGVDYSETFNINADETLIACIGLGYEYGGVFKKNTDKKAERKGPVEFVYDNEFCNLITWEKLSQMGLEEVFYLTKFAPSWGNKQPWSFIVAEKEVYLVMEKTGEGDLDLETGIIALYFIKAAEAKGIKINMKAFDIADGIKVPDTQEIKIKFYF